MFCYGQAKCESCTHEEWLEEKDDILVKSWRRPLKRWFIINPNYPPPKMSSKVISKSGFKVNLGDALMDLYKVGADVGPTFPLRFLPRALPGVKPMPMSTNGWKLIKSKKKMKKRKIPLEAQNTLSNGRSKLEFWMKGKLILTCYLLVNLPKLGLFLWARLYANKMNDMQTLCDYIFTYSHIYYII